MKLFQNLTSLNREEFLKIFLYPYSASSLHSPEPCFLTDQNFTNELGKVPPKEDLCEIVSKSDQQFQKVAMASRVLDGIKFCEQYFKEELLRNIPAKFSPNWSNGLLEKDLVRIFS